MKTYFYSNTKNDEKNNKYTVYEVEVLKKFKVKEIHTKELKEEEIKLVNAD